MVWDWLGIIWLSHLDNSSEPPVCLKLDLFIEYFKNDRLESIIFCCLTRSSRLDIISELSWEAYFTRMSGPVVRGCRAQRRLQMPPILKHVTWPLCNIASAFLQYRWNKKAKYVVAASKLIVQTLKSPNAIKFMAVEIYILLQQPLRWMQRQMTERDRL